MQTSAFKQHVLSKVVPRPRRLPETEEFKWDFDPGSETIVLDLPAEALTLNLQCTLAASPSYLFCLGYWLSLALNRPVNCVLRVKGNPPTEGDGPAFRDWNRSVFVIKHLELASDQFRAEIPDANRWHWPPRPLLNSATKPRTNSSSPKPRSEHMLETSLCGNALAAERFAVGAEPIGRLERQLPVGLFNGKKLNKHRWTPGGKSQVDLWTTSVDGSTVHLFELKADRKNGLGILPQSLYYGRLLHHLRAGKESGVEIEGGCKELVAIRASKRIRVWLAASVVHPLLRHGDHSPIELLNARFRPDGVQFEILPLAVTPTGEWSAWLWDNRWPRSRASDATH